MDREKTNSITHLVKIVAREVFDEREKEIMKAIKSHIICEVGRQTKATNLFKVDMKEAEERVISSILSGITSSLEKAGRPWSTEEDELLLHEVRTAIAQIAKNHHRSKGAITSRIEQKELIGRTYGN